MRLSLFKENKRVLLVGEGNFSFAVTLVKHNININLTATCYENNVNKTVKKNIDFLQSYGTQVLLGIDATKLEEYKILNSKSFDVVVFNFPHVGGKMRIEKNRELIKNFFMSVNSVLQKNGQIFMSLCNGQGGTIADAACRKWNDSWQVTEMAAYGDFILVDIEPFDSLLFKTYTVTGYRSLEKQFNTQGSLTHIFKLVDRSNNENIAPEMKIDLNNSYNKLMDWKELVPNIDYRKNVDLNNGSNLSLFPNYYQFDITFYITPEFNTTKLFETLYNHAGLIIDNVEFLGSYVFANLKETRTFRITYKSQKFPLYRKLVIEMHENIIPEIIKNVLNVSVPR